MDFAAQLAAAKLKKSAPPKADAAPKMKAICADEQDYKRLMEETYFEEYWEKMKPYTWGSAFVPLPPATAKDLTEAHLKFLADKEGYRDKWKEEYSSLVALSHGIDEVHRCQIPSPEMFVRLSSRSPKDAALSGKRFKQLFEEELKQVQLDEAQAASTTAINQKLHALYRASTFALKVKTGEEGVQLLVESPRIQGDLKEVVDGNKADFNVVVREWGIFDVELEFRAFVHEKRLTAITQYNEFIYFPRMVSQKVVIEGKIRSFVENKIVPLFTTMKSYVLDLALSYPRGEGDDYQVYIVEVNPLAEFAGTGLFSWTEDWQIILGEKPFEFRTHMHEPPHAIENIAKNWVLPDYMQG